VTTTPAEPVATRRTKRRYAHELYPHAGEWETRPLAVEVPYSYARAIGFDIHGTGWIDMREEELKLAGQRTHVMQSARIIALLADALHQGLTGEEAWAWADRRSWDYEGEVLWERATHYGVPVEQIKPYPCGPEPEYHDHYGEADAHGWRTSTHIDCKESECPECTEEIPAEEPA
jgi:hypothetical protein